ncbi:glycosyltransferase [Sphingopyxis sp. J-6]|uniref:glycosyltransferase n=1 Tax=Sphingopyxis sp. J-6 TaxID=3122054 RepID=UPI003984432C
MTSWVILGSVPPPIGGVTTFVERFSDRLVRRGASVTVVNPQRPAELPRLMGAAARRPDFVILNTVNLLGLIVSRLLFPCTKLILVDHNHSRKVVALAAAGGLRGRVLVPVYRLLLSTFDAIWIVSPHLDPHHRQIGHGTRTRRINPYIRPDARHHDAVVATYSDRLRGVMEGATDESGPLFLTSAYKLVREQGRDLYGFDLALEALARLIATGRRARLIAFVADTSDPEALHHFQAEAVRLGVADAVIWETGQKILWPVFARADCYLRLTSTDGWSISVEEALDFGCTVIASDVTPRDPRCVLFPYPDMDALVDRMSAVASRSKIS